MLLQRERASEAEERSTDGGGFDREAKLVNNCYSIFTNEANINPKPKPRNVLFGLYSYL